MPFTNHMFAKYILFFLFFIPVFFLPKASAEPTIHRFATYNIRYGNADDTGDKAWINRKSYVMQIIRDYDFDIAGLQEVTGNSTYPQLQDMQTTLTEYNFIPYERSGSGNYSYNVVIYKKAKYECIEHGCFWVSPTPNTPSMGWDGPIMRTVIWSRMKDLNTNEIFYFCTTHTNGPEIQVGRKGAKVITDKLKQIVGDYPMVLVGDFNHRRTDGVTTYKGFASNFYDSYFIADESASIPIANTTITAQNWYPADHSSISGSEFDYIFCDNIKVFNRYIITENYNRSINPSDHFPVLATCQLLGRVPKKSIYVNNSVAVSGNGTLNNPYATIDEALAAAHIRDTIKITADRYIPGLKPDIRTSCFTPNSSVILIGGYNEDFSEITGKTIISGDVNNDDDSGNFSDNLYQLISIPKYHNLTLKNFILENAHAEGLINGGGLYTEGFELKIENVEFNNNITANSGGGLYASCEFIDINNCIFNSNKATGNGGGANFTALTNFTLNNSYFKNNDASGGSAICLTQTETSFFQNNTFESNTSSKFGTLYLMSNSNVISHNLLNNTFANNQLNGVSGLPVIVSTYGGAAIYAKMHSVDTKINIAHTTIVGNQSNYSGTNISIFKGAALNIYGGSTILMNNIIAGNYGANACGDFSTDGNTVINKETYNLFTSPENVSITMNSTDLTALNYAVGVDSLSKTLDGYVKDGKFTANIQNHGGFTPTVSILKPVFNNNVVNCLSANLRLVESSFQLDLDGDGKTTGYVKYDQRGKSRQLKSCIGAYEYIDEETNLESSTVQDEMKLYRLSNTKYKVNNITGDSVITLYDRLGRCLLNTYNKETSIVVDFNGHSPGIYFLFINNITFKLII